MKPVAYATQLFQRVHRLEDREEEREKLRGFERLINEHLLSANPDNHNRGNHAEKFRSRRSHVADTRDLQYVVEELLRLAGELPIFEFFHSERLDDIDTSNRFLEDRRNVCHLRLNIAALFMESDPDSARHLQRERKDKNRNESQLPAD